MIVIVVETVNYPNKFCPAFFLVVVPFLIWFVLSYYLENLLLFYPCSYWFVVVGHFFAVIPLLFPFNLFNFFNFYFRLLNWT